MTSNIQDFSFFMFRICIRTFTPITATMPLPTDMDERHARQIHARDFAIEASDNIKAAEHLRSQRRAMEAKKKRHEEKEKAMKQGIKKEKAMKQAMKQAMK